MSIERAQIEYWRERRDEMQARVEGLRKAYAEARTKGASGEELRELRERGERLASRSPRVTA
ncbi:MAG: hypothetical protein M3Q49_05970 [Actinomycetota bacterium]|nr:hypothetical protein [Actinomycetota bacterium]